MKKVISFVWVNKFVRPNFRIAFCYDGKIHVEGCETEQERKNIREALSKESRIIELKGSKCLFDRLDKYEEKINVCLELYEIQENKLLNASRMSDKVSVLDRMKNTVTWLNAWGEKRESTLSDIISVVRTTLYIDNENREEKRIRNRNILIGVVAAVGAGLAFVFVSWWSSKGQKSVGPETIPARTEWNGRWNERTSGAAPMLESIKDKYEVHARLEISQRKKTESNLFPGTSPLHPNYSSKKPTSEEQRAQDMEWIRQRKRLRKYIEDAAGSVCIDDMVSWDDLCIVKPKLPTYDDIKPTTEAEHVSGGSSRGEEIDREFKKNKERDPDYGEGKGPASFERVEPGIFERIRRFCTVVDKGNVWSNPRREAVGEHENNEPTVQEAPIETPSFTPLGSLVFRALQKIR